MDALLKPLADTLAMAPPSKYCQAFFLAAAASVLALQLLPREARRTLTDYGARRPRRASSPTSSRSRLASALSELTAVGQVPHAYFWHFYLLSTGLSALWMWQFITRGSVVSFIAERQVSLSGEASAAAGRVFLAWLMMAAQGGRRLYECFWVLKPGRTPMWWVHWALGLGFYAAMSVSVWVEGARAMLGPWQACATDMRLTARELLTLAVFLGAWFEQHRCHRYLASLRKYSLPEGGLFKHIVCPHYTSECVVYLAISIMAAPPGNAFNVSVLCGLAFVVANLGSTAHGTKEWYAGEFGADKVGSKWRMIPGVF
ncbi:3-oxo-5-alpha-steroid 4-dehydrogenase [Metarhizium album ARSEF 1941]|uniref:Polyprenal reductase n=1 Tax=Metarhizium album (strain ARSEF 1941) TaxID=1081103 RepID=A0A0B2X2Q3_METAS|nr:3-oxo-5-alpha-steroid 4-dehydrogenase [Metarhizium album ARSEF 1941]KHN99555.1 3-oxo-5-alpha-steroid 4-dehydrogenase [Metarhizium album ARSEF 1941]